MSKEHLSKILFHDKSLTSGTIKLKFIKSDLFSKLSIHKKLAFFSIAKSLIHLYFDETTPIPAAQYSIVLVLVCKLRGCISGVKLSPALHFE